MPKIDPTKTEPMEQRLVSLESKSAFTDDLVVTLNEVVTQQDARIRLLERQLATQFEQIRQLAVGVGHPHQDSVDDPPPPHY
jgi:uncharacterized coiled-coil protein SlyX